MRFVLIIVFLLGIGLGSSSHCNEGCSNDNCKDNGECIEGCRANYYGSHCNETCPPNCHMCEDSNNACTRCNNGYYGAACDILCSEHCVHYTCNKIDGYCSHGCVPGYKNAKCDSCVTGYFSVNSTCIKCPTICESCVSYNNCNSFVNRTFYGSTCKTPCSPGCHEGTCCKDGVCYGGCKPGYIGAKCDQCADGKYGDECELLCPNNCITCISNTRCNSCENGWYGIACESPCADSCNKSCEKTSGTCTNGCTNNTVFGATCQECKNGYYGVDCQAKCASICINGTCERDTGYCTHGCVEGFKGVKCGEASREGSRDGSLVVGSVIGAVVFLLLIAALAATVVYKRRSRNPGKPNAPSLTKYPGSNEEMAERGGLSSVHTTAEENDPSDTTYDQPDLNIAKPTQSTYERVGTDKAPEASDNRDSGDSEYEQLDKDVHTVAPSTEMTYQQLESNQPERTYGQLEPDNSTYEQLIQNTAQPSQSMYEELDRDQLDRDTTEVTYKQLGTGGVCDDTSSADFYDVAEALHVSKK